MDLLATNRRVIDQLRAGGEVDGMHRDRLLLLTTTGRRSGEPRTSPMMFHAEGDRLFVIASALGAASDPLWCRNLRADPAVHVELGDGSSFDADARVLAGEDRTAVWARIQELYPFFVEHEERARPREIPVVELVRNAATR